MRRAMAEENAVVLARSVLSKIKLFCGGGQVPIKPAQNQKTLRNLTTEQIGSED
jgi:hypothetical protein